jgi:hypothetical protein
VVIGRAAQERRDAGDGVAHLEADAVDEEALARVEVGRAEDDVAELPRPHRRVAKDRVGSRGLPIETTGAVRRRRSVRRLRQARRRLHDDPHRRAGVDRDDRRRRPLDGNVALRERARDAAEIVGVVGADAELDQPTVRRLHEPELLAAVRRREVAAAEWPRARTPRNTLRSSRRPARRS